MRRGPHNLLCDDLWRARIDEEDAALQPQRALHNPQSLFDHHQRRTVGSLYRAVATYSLATWYLLCHL